MLARLKLARWLGPWASPAKAPRVERREEVVEDGEGAPIRTRVYGRRGRPVLVAPGLHYAGPADPRMDRFCAVLAAAGHVVVAPFVADYLALTPGLGASKDFERAYRALPRWSDAPPVIFSISFGSLLAFALAAKHDVAGVVAFGGYADFHETMRFCLAGETGSGRIAVRDPLNQSVVLLNLLDVLEPPPADRAAIADAWRRYVERTWGRPALKDPAKFSAIARELAPSVDERVRELFLVGVGAVPGALDLATPALQRFDARPLDPSPYFARIRCRVDLVHGTDDDVIPFEQSQQLHTRLRAAGVDAHLHLTGLYDHTASHRPPLAATLRELRTMWRILGALAQ